MANSPTHTERFTGQVAIVTGAGNGIGLAIAQSFAAEGAIVIIAEIDQQAGERARETIERDGGKAIAWPLDISDEPAITAMVEEVVKQFGHIDILVNNAGITVHKLLVDLSREEWERQLAVQITGPFLMAKHVARHMIARGGPGKIVNISSVAALMGRVKCGPHCVTKGGLTQLTKVLAMELAPYQINVNALAPGLVDVPYQEVEEHLSSAYQDAYLKMLPLGRLGTPADIAHGVTFLASTAADWITGQLFVADGGLTAGHYALQGLHDFSSDAERIEKS